MQNPNNPIQQALENSYSYQEYQEQMAKFVQNKKTSGKIQSEELTKYTKLNLARMRRLNKKLRLDESVLKTLDKMTHKYTWLVLTESWCGDAAQSLPVMHKIAELSPNLTFRVAYRDENPDLMNQFLTNNAAMVPKLIMLNDDYSVIADWGPRPTTATKKVEQYKKKHGTLSAEFKEQLQIWYNKDLGKEITDDLHVLLLNAIMQNEKVILY